MFTEVVELEQVSTGDTFLIETDSSRDDLIKLARQSVDTEGSFDYDLFFESVKNEGYYIIDASMELIKF